MVILKEIVFRMNRGNLSDQFSYSFFAPSCNSILASTFSSYQFAVTIQVIDYTENGNF